MKNRKPHYYLVRGLFIGLGGICGTGHERVQFILNQKDKDALAGDWNRVSADWGKAFSVCQNALDKQRGYQTKMNFHEEKDAEYEPAR